MLWRLQLLDVLRLLRCFLFELSLKFIYFDFFTDVIVNCSLVCGRSVCGDMLRLSEV